MKFFRSLCQKGNSQKTSSTTPLIDSTDQARTVVNYQAMSDIEAPAQPSAATEAVDSSKLLIRILVPVIIAITRIYGVGNCTLYSEATLLGISGLIAAFWKTLDTVPTIILSVCCELTIMFFLMPTIHGAYLPKLQKAMGQGKMQFTKRGAMGGFCKGGPTGFSVYFMLRNFTPEIVKDSLPGVIAFALISVIFVIVHTLCEGALFSERKDQSFKAMLKFMFEDFPMLYHAIRNSSSTNSEPPPPYSADYNSIEHDEEPFEEARDNISNLPATSFS